MRVLGRGGLRVRVVLAFLGITWKLLLSHRSRGRAGQGADDMRNATKAGDEKNRLVRVPEEPLHSTTSLLI